MEMAAEPLVQIQEIPVTGVDRRPIRLLVMHGNRIAHTITRQYGIYEAWPSAHTACNAATAMRDKLQR